MSDSESRPMFCASCGKPTTPDARFCKNCGAQTDGGQQTDIVLCVSCGHPRTSDAMFCEKCGLRFHGGQQAAAGVAPNPIQTTLRNSSQSSPSPRTEHSPARRRIRFIMGGAVALAIILFVYFSPHISFYQLKRAAEANDIDALRDRVDFPALRESLKEAAQDEIAKKQAAEAKADNNPLAAMRTLFAGGIANSLIDTMMTPANFARLIRGETFDASALVGGFGAARAKPTPSSAEPRYPHTSMSYESLNKFAVRLTNLAEMDGSVVLVFTRSGLGWKLTGMLPATAQDQANAAAHQPAGTAPSFESEHAASGREQQRAQEATAAYAGLARFANESTDKEEFFKQPEVEQPLRKLLGGQYDTFTQSIVVSQAANLQGNVLTVSGCMPHACPWQGAAVSVDLSSGTFVAGIQLGSEVAVHGSGNENIEALPQGLRDWINSVNKGLVESRNAPVTVAFK